MFRRPTVSSSSLRKRSKTAIGLLRLPLRLLAISLGQYLMGRSSTHARMGITLQAPISLVGQDDNFPGADQFEAACAAAAVKVGMGRPQCGLP